MDKNIKILKISLICIFLNLFISFNIGAFENKKNELGAYFSTKVYEERHPVNNSFFMSQDGFMLGLKGNNENYFDKSYFGLKYTLGYGQVDYTSARTGTMTGIPDYQMEGTGYYGIPFDSFNKRITPFTGLGYRYLLNASGLKATSTGHSGYDRESRYMYLPIGVNFETNLSPTNSYWELRGEYLHFLYGQQKSKLSQVSPNYKDITNDQEDGSGIKLSAKYHFDSKSGIEGFMDYWNIADSKVDVSGHFMEPRNTTSETGIKYFWKF